MGGKNVGVYDPAHRNPLYCGAYSTSLWELKKLSEHFHPSVVLFVRTVLQSQNQDGKRRKDLRTRAACLVQQRSLVICWMKIQDRSLTILALMQSQTKLKQTSSSSSGRLSEMTGCVAGMPKLYGRRRRCSRERNLWESSKQENKTCISKRVACISDGQCERVTCISDGQYKRFSKCVACISDGQCERFSKCVACISDGQCERFSKCF